ncbi:hypothetical protein ACQVRV_00105 (plasmid) [Ralstonia pseudosolanacearum]
MRIEDEAAALVAAVDPADVAAVIAEYPEAEDVGIRENWFELNPHVSRRVPKAPAARAEYLAKLIEENQDELQDDIARYNELRERGLAALTPYDICISSGNDPLGALRCALDLKDAHISYQLSILVRLALELEDTRAELARVAKPAPASAPVPALTPARAAVDMSAFRPGVRCEVTAARFPSAFHKVGMRVVVTRVNPAFGSVWAHEDKPVTYRTYRTNRAGRRVVDHDPSCIQSIYGMDELQVLP